jgi:DNA repair ATPase RecN
MDNTQLPAEVVSEISNKAETLYNQLDSLAREYDQHEYGLPYVENRTWHIEAMLTEYATKQYQAQQECASKLHDADKKFRSLSSAFASHKRTHDRISEELSTARSLLAKFILRHEGGLLPDTFIYKEIKTFLDGK